MALYWGAWVLNMAWRGAAIGIIIKASDSYWPEGEGKCSRIIPVGESLEAGHRQIYIQPQHSFIRVLLDAKTPSDRILSHILPSPRAFAGIASSSACGWSRSSPLYSGIRTCSHNQRG